MPGIRPALLKGRLFPAFLRPLNDLHFPPAFLQFRLRAPLLKDSVSGSCPWAVRPCSLRYSVNFCWTKLCELSSVRACIFLVIPSPICHPFYCWWCNERFYILLLIILLNLPVYFDSYIQFYNLISNPWWKRPSFWNGFSAAGFSPYHPCPPPFPGFLFI